MLSTEELRDLPDGDLDTLADGVERELNRRKKRRTREIIRQAKTMLAAAGFDVELRPIGQAPQKEKGKPETVKAKLPPGTYQNPDQPDLIWRSGGRGRQPRWLRDAIEAGTDVSEWLVEDEEEEAEVTTH